MQITRLCSTVLMFAGLAGMAGALTPQQAAQRIQWVGQACVRIEIGGLILYSDPFGISKPENADVILITHAHGDHYNPDQIDQLGTPRKIFAPFDVPDAETLLPGMKATVGKVTITAVPSYNVQKTQFHPKSDNNVGYLIQAEGVTIYLAGDTERIPEMKNFTCDIAIVPLGQTYTMNSVQEAVDSVLDVKASMAFPYHYGVYEGSEDDAKVFVKALKAAGVKAGLLPLLK